MTAFTVPTMLFALLNLLEPVESDDVLAKENVDMYIHGDETEHGRKSSRWMFTGKVTGQPLGA